jgi:PAS domain S-box-containing protein
MILDLADDAIISVDRQFHIILFNQGAERIFDYAASEMMGQDLDVLLPSRLVDTHRNHLRDFERSDIHARRMGERREIRGRRRSGEEFPAEASISKVSMGGETMFTVILRDVTLRTQADEVLRASLREKEALLREIHHRVKNNLQVVSSLLGLQSRSIGDEHTRKMFQESQNRIHSMALLHESLYQSESLARIDFPEYINRLSAYLFHSFGVDRSRISFRSNLDMLYLTMDAAVPCGLIINELLSNSLKYAFPGDRRGEIFIGLKDRWAGKAQLTIADNGIGLSKDFNWTAAKSLGLRLVRTLSKQLGAQLEMDSTSGTGFHLTFAVAS